MPGDDNPREGVVLSRAGKASSNTRNWYNVEYRRPEDLRGNKMSIELSRVDELELVKSDTDQDIEDNKELEEAFFNEIEFCDARKAELDNWKRHNVYKEVEDFGQSCVSSRWHDSNGLAGERAFHIDDFLWAGTNLLETEVILKIREELSVGKEVSESFKYLGLGLSHTDDKIIQSQTDYVEVLNTVSIDRKG
ncbi:unnamed protein product [Mytilus coruscus]|uniref:Uncharacterized protein n=1 Tax=Mytilus coruscus TaxID=42192 RepID=A0A6J8BT28_MYTCO|nr:unnamed protein product [Mytilus coruscus]